jgi:formylglycine-generating enzyme required for sulfatase activity
VWRYVNQLVGVATFALIAGPSPEAFSFPVHAFSAGEEIADDSAPARIDFEELPAWLLPDVVWISPGTFTMGSPPDEGWRDPSDEDQHEVILTKGLYIGVTEVTQAQWTSVMGSNPSYFFDCDDCPVERVSWRDVVEYCNTLSLLDGRQVAYEINGTKVTWLPGTNGYRLPTDAEWEYACRAGTSTAFHNGEITNGWCDDPNLDLIAWYCGVDDPKQTSVVAQKQPNAWGLYDMTGNVQEWCWDWYQDHLSGPVIDPQGPETGYCRVWRGGRWSGTSPYCRSASRTSSRPWDSHGYRGFRIARSAS